MNKSEVNEMIKEGCFDKISGITAVKCFLIRDELLEEFSRFYERFVVQNPDMRKSESLNLVLEVGGITEGKEKAEMQEYLTFLNEAPDEGLDYDTASYYGVRFSGLLDRRFDKELILVIRSLPAKKLLEWHDELYNYCQSEASEEEVDEKQQEILTKIMNHYI